MLRLLALPLLVVALQPYESSIQPLLASVKANLEGRFWEPGCLVGLAATAPHRLHWGFDGVRIPASPS